MKDRILSGMRPTGRLHLGNYFGALKNWIELQKTYECFFFIADFHALTTSYESPADIRSNVEEMALDFLAAGIDPGKSTLFLQSLVPTHAEAHLLFSMFTPLAWLERTPSYKEMIETLKDRDLRTYGFLGYPLLQTVDIVLYHPKFVPVGVDQVPHIELCREIVRRFNHLYKSDLPEPQPLLTASPKLPGIDGQKMSKSYNNTIELFGSASETKKRIMSIKTDSTPVGEPKDPAACNVFAILSLLCGDAERKSWEERYRAGGMGYGDVKKALAEKYEEVFGAMRARRDELARDRGAVWEILRKGSARALDISTNHLAAMRRAIGIAY
ncbi:tryptophan--tRNA ligase [bacterium]|nr:tryptophan--tRNA ligase [bacterium]